ncbi:CDP-glycerol glycerophosphotransferase family protein [Natronosalvus halobius]|uniref:CDP-glycerol glycerophosphotransferase family protein n=1 Tax=Natronosalvus halobius TaxID=2953746 RepID=UPI00209E5673|nr:CDP-glycerol glycerophosphotransferase family protein [Natronosalvus halobius]USZ71454.1 CDP-glycerol glycerophosphotransferase family protein [Natronosalvus halobius]
MQEIRRAIEIYNQEGGKKLLIDSKDYLVRQLSVIVYVITYVASMFFEKDDSIWLFTNHARNAGFSDNGKYLYLYLNEETDERAIWLTSSKEVHDALNARGYEVYRSDSWKARYLRLKSKYIVTTTTLGLVEWAYYGGSTIIQLWHGVPLKNLNLTGHHEPVHDLKEKLLKYDFLVVNSELTEQYLKETKRYTKAIYAGYPRNDVLLKDIPNSSLGIPVETNDLLEEIGNSETIIGYFPTWRKYEVNYDNFEYDRFDEFLEENDAHFLYKPHRYMEVNIDDQYDRIHLLPAYGDIYPLLEEFDIMITDYSSIVFDYLLLDNPAIFYPFDFELYEKERGFHLDYDEFTPGPKAYDFASLLQTIEECIDEDEYGERRRDVRRKILQGKNPHACEHIYETIKSES